MQDALSIQLPAVLSHFCDFDDLLCFWWESCVSLPFDQCMLERAGCVSFLFLVLRADRCLWHCGLRQDHQTVASHQGAAGFWGFCCLHHPAPQHETFSIRARHSSARHFPCSCSSGRHSALAVLNINVFCFTAGCTSLDTGNKSNYLSVHMHGQFLLLIINPNLSWIVYDESPHHITTVIIS